jgi:hypothetical protein
MAIRLCLFFLQFWVGQVEYGTGRGTVRDNASTWFSIDCDSIFGLVPKVFHLIVCVDCGTGSWDSSGQRFCLTFN